MTSAEYYKNEEESYIKRLRAIDEIKESEKLRDELKEKYLSVYKLEEQIDFTQADGTKLEIKERPCETIWAIEDEIKNGNITKIINNNKDNATVQAIIAWKQQEITAKSLKDDFEREYAFMEDRKWWAVDENNCCYLYY